MRWIITLFGESIKGDENSEVMNVPNSMVGSIIGRGGETIQAIQRNSGCHVQVAREVSPLVSQLGFVSRSIGRSVHGSSLRGPLWAQRSESISGASAFCGGGPRKRRRERGSRASMHQWG